MKELTGGTEIKARLNYSNDNKVTLCLTLFFECNNKPKLDEVGDAMGGQIFDILFSNKFVSQDKYDNLIDEEKKTTFPKNTHYKTMEFKNEYRQALLILLSRYHKIYMNNKREYIVPDAILKRTRAYLADSDELLNWLEENYEPTENKKDIIKIKSIFEEFKKSHFFENLTKAQKRTNNYKNFVDKLEKNFFIKKFVTQDNHGTAILTNYKEIIETDEPEKISPLYR